MAKIINGRKDGKVLVENGYIFQKNRVCPGVIYWRCGDCHSTLKTSFFDVNDPPEIIEVIYDADAHNHPPMEQIINKQIVTSRIKDSVITNPSEPIRRLYDAAIALEERNDNPLPLEDIPTFQRIESQLKRAKYSHVPEIPHGVENVIIENEWGQTWQGRNNLIHQDNDWGILIFGTNRNIRLLLRADAIFADGTFRTCPHPYRQMYTIHVKILDHVFCAVTCLMVNSNIGSYRAILQILKDKVRNVTGERWAPNIVVLDFEQAAIVAFETEFPGIDVNGCYFHLNQSLWRGVQRLGLVHAYRNNRQVERCVKKLMALGFLPLVLVRMNFNILITNQRTRRLFLQYPGLREFFGYFRRNYLEGNFPPRMWNVFRRTMDIRTNNAVESYHNRWNRAVGVRHPSLWHFIRTMKDQQAVTNVKIRAVVNGEDPPRRRRKWRILENRINLLKERYNNGELNVNRYWNAVTHVILDN